MKKNEEAMEWIQMILTIILVISAAHYLQDAQKDMQAQSARTDRLYEMIIELTKEGKK